MRRTILLPLSLALVACGAGPSERSPAPIAPPVALSGVVPSAQAESWTQEPDRIADVAESAVEAVVFIQSRQDAPARVQGTPLPPGLFGLPIPMPIPDGPRIGVGSGVIVDDSGLVITNHHVVDGATQLEVTLADGRRLGASVRGTDPKTDLALLQLEGEVPDDLPTLSFGDSDRLRLGEVVLAIGAPFALRGSVSMGIVSARGRTAQGLVDQGDFIQTDAAINPGNSGGALVDLRGQLVGINTLIRSSSGGNNGVGYAVSANLARSVMAQLAEHGEVRRGFLGVGIQAVPPDFADVFQLPPGTMGTLVSEVQDGTPAAQAGLSSGDVITEVDGEPVDGPNALRNTLSLKGPGAEVRLTYIRDGRARRTKATLAPLPSEGGQAAPEPDPDAPSLLDGLQVEPVATLRQREPALAAQLPERGVVVTALGDSVVARRAGLRPGDVIIEVNGRPIQDGRDLAEALDGAPRAMLGVRRGEASVYLFLRP